MRRGRLFSLSLVWALVLASPALANRIRVGDVLRYGAETPHPYPAGRGHRPVVWSELIVSPGAAFVRVHFRGMRLAPGDYVTVSSPGGEQHWIYTGRGPNGTGRFWSFAVDGDTALVELHAGPRTDHGFRIDRIAHGAVPVEWDMAPGPRPTVVCGDDGREDVACYSSDATLDARQKSVARLLFTSGGGQYVCTGWLVDGSNASTMLTNAHCFTSQAEVDTVQAKFNYQRTSCGGTSDAVTTDYAGGTLLRTNSEVRKGKKGGLDYTLFTLQGNPEATWGELVATTKAPSLGEPIWFLQHPGGGLKKVGVWENAAQTAPCDVDTVNATYGSAAPGSQMGYACDSEGGSSGSPILRRSTGRVIGLHHYGAVSGSPCLNAATMMAPICANAGSLLRCVND